MANALSRFMKPSGRGATDAGLLLLRLWVGLVLAFGHGLTKVLTLGKFIATVERHGFPLPQLFGPGPADEIGRAARSIGQDELDRLVRPALGLCRGFGREACGQRGTGETQELTTSHAVLPVDYWPQDEGWVPAPSIHRKRNAAIRF